MGAHRMRGIGDDFIDFAEHTSAHGIPRAYVSEGFRRVLWALLCVACLCAFGYQAYLIIQRFQRNDIIVGVEIKFERIAFPSVTICNLNPYKNSLAREMAAVKATLQAFDSAVSKNAGQQDAPRRKRAVSHSIPEARSSFAACLEDDGHWIADTAGTGRCICAHSASSDVWWNCAPAAEWTTKTCGECDAYGYCREEESSHPLLCHCNAHAGCILAEDQIQVEGRWPLSIAHSPCPSSNHTCLCAAPTQTQPALTAAYCRPVADWQLAKCHGCDWWGRCVRSFALDAVDECICDGDSLSDCFAVHRSTRPTRIGPSHSELETIRLLRGDDAPVTPPPVEEPAPPGGRVRVRRQSRRVYEKILSRFEGLLAVYSKCECKAETGCLASKSQALAPADSKTCLCFYDKKNNVVWPCYEEKDWGERKCSRCSTFGDCAFSDDPKAKKDCFCAMPIKMCVRIDPPEGNTTLSERIVKFWEIVPTTTASPQQKKKEKQEKAFGLQEIKDPIALKAKASENLMFAVDKMNDTDKIALSYSKKEFITKCSFNGRECSVENDFSLHIDPVYGNCYKFNYNMSEQVTSERAGPTYGLRIQVFVNVSEYLPTTEAAGVRLTVHSPHEQPFPDTLGYSAPTGFVSSFGIRLKHMTRLPAPYGDCITEGKDDDFIYRDKMYSTEGCQRSCIQKYLVKACGCGDPRFPQYKAVPNCPADEPDLRQCLLRETKYAARFIDQIGCRCQQPCSQDVYSVSYSASRWPAVPESISDCPPGLPPQHCLHYYREQGAMIEVFFEQLNYESLKESEAYGFSNVLSDFGGQLGLWMGVSVITMMELAVLIFDMMLTICGLGSTKRKLSSRKSLSSSFRYH